MMRQLFFGFNKTLKSMQFSLGKAALTRLAAALKFMLRCSFIFLLIVALVFSQVDGALAARSGGRIGGGSFSMPSRSYSAPRSYRSSPTRGYYPGGGGIGFPFLIPFIGFGGGGLFTLLIFLAIAGFLVQTFRRFREEGSEGTVYSNPNPNISIARLQVGLLASARSLQADLNKMAQTADTGSASGRVQVLQEATLALLRHPEYWVYGAADSQQCRLNAAETVFNQLSLAERSKFTAETLSNVNNQLRQAEKSALAQTDADNLEGTGAYLVVTLLVGTQNKVSLPVIQEAEELRQALRQLGSVGSDQLLAIEVLWTPQAEGDTLSAEELLTEYVDLKRL